MVDEQAAQARELHRTLDFIGLRAQATTVGLIQLCTELVRPEFWAMRPSVGSRIPYTGSLRHRVRVAATELSSRKR